MFTENQVRQFYVATTTVAPVKDNAASVAATDNPGKAQFVVNGDDAYFIYSGAIKGDLQRTDLIKKCNVMDVRLTDAADMVHKNKKAVITLDTSFVSSTNLAVSGDYILNVEIKNYIAPDNTCTRVKFGAVRGTTSTSVSDFYKKMALSLAKNFSREPAPLVKIYINTAATGASASNTEITAKTDISSLSSITAAAIVIEEAEQPWRKGAACVEYVDFVVAPSTVYNNGMDVIWGKVQFAGSSKYTDGTSSATTIGAAGTQPNSKKVADMEWFFHKERGDVYGEIGYPNNIDTVYQVDPANTDGYSFVDIHFYFEGNSHNVGKSEKTLTVVGTKANLKTLIGVATSGSETGLYAFLKGTGVTPKASASW